MKNKNKSEIEKPWAVVYFHYPLYIGKIIQEESNCSWINFGKGQGSDPWDLFYIERFETSLKAIKYFLEKSRIRYVVGDYVEKFLNLFPEEKNNLENFAQSQP
jgi:hypothetical protein